MSISLSRQREGYHELRTPEEVRFDVLMDALLRSSVAGSTLATTRSFLARPHSRCGSSAELPIQVVPSARPSEADLHEMGV